MSIQPDIHRDCPHRIINNIFCSLCGAVSYFKPVYPAIYCEKRNYLFNIIKWINNKLDFNSQTFFLTVFYMDTIFTQDKFISESVNDYTLFALCCLFVASKFNENDPHVPDIHKYINICFEVTKYTARFSVDDIRNGEVAVLRLLQYKLNYFTVYHFWVFFFAHGVLFRKTYENYEMNWNKKGNNHWNQRKVLEKIYILSREWMDSLIEDDTWFKYSIGKDNYLCAVEIFRFAIRNILGDEVHDEENVLKTVYNITNTNVDIATSVAKIIERKILKKKGESVAVNHVATGSKVPNSALPSKRAGLNIENNCISNNKGGVSPVKKRGWESGCLNNSTSKKGKKWDYLQCNNEKLQLDTFNNTNVMTASKTLNVRKEWSNINFRKRTMSSNKEEKMSSNKDNYNCYSNSNGGCNNNGNNSNSNGNNNNNNNIISSQIHANEDPHHPSSRFHKDYSNHTNNANNYGNTTHNYQNYPSSHNDQWHTHKHNSQNQFQNLLPINENKVNTLFPEDLLNKTRKIFDSNKTRELAREGNKTINTTNLNNHTTTYKEDGYTYYNNYENTNNNIPRHQHPSTTDCKKRRLGDRMNGSNTIIINNNININTFNLNDNPNTLNWDAPLVNDKNFSDSNNRNTNKSANNNNNQRRGHFGTYYDYGYDEYWKNSNTLAESKYYTKKNMSSNMVCVANGNYNQYY